MVEKTKTVAPLFDVELRQTKEYIDDHICKKIDDFKSGPCVDEDRDVPILTGFGSLEDLDVLGAQMHRMKIDHDGDVGLFLESCPHLDAVRAMELLSEFPLREAIEKGKLMTMTPRGCVAHWVVSQIHEPTDQNFRKADAKQMSFEREVRRLGDAYEPAPVQKIVDLEKSITDAADPAKTEECYKQVRWSPEIMEERKQAAKLVQAKAKKSKKVKKNLKKGNESVIKKVASKQQFKASGVNKKENKLEVKEVRKSGSTERDAKDNKTIGDKTQKKKKDATTVFATGPSDEAGPSTSTVSAKPATRSSTRYGVSKPYTSSSKSESKKARDPLKVTSVNKDETKIEKVKKTNKTSHSMYKVFQRVWTDKTFVPFSLPSDYFT